MDSYSNLLTVRDLAEFLAVSVESVRGMLKRREIPVHCIVRVGKRRVRFHAGRIREWLGLGLEAGSQPSPRPDEPARA